VSQLDFLGTGAPFPFVPTNGRVPFVSGADKVRQSILLILETEPGERIMRPDFGCGLRRYLMEPNNEATRARLAASISEALELWEPRISVDEVNVYGADDPAAVIVSIRYQHVRDGSEGAVLFPFRLRGE
jgi:phage baseplate assembly protein W